MIINLYFLLLRPSCSFTSDEIFLKNIRKRRVAGCSEGSLTFSAFMMKSLFLPEMIVIALLMCLYHSLVCVAMVMLPAK